MLSEEFAAKVTVRAFALMFLLGECAAPSLQRAHSRPRTLGGSPAPSRGDIEVWRLNELVRLDRVMKDRREKTEVTSSVAGTILSVIGLPFASIAADATAALAERAYSRAHERDADRMGLQHLRQAGFANAGAINLRQRLLPTRGNALIPFLSTHPSGEERIEQLRQLMRNSD